jgi:pyruvate formate lyase activating enzyme
MTLDRKPLVFNIQKFSTHDGDGVRTTIFFKGCPLKCRWCHNPESQRFEKELIFHRNKCVVCGKCVVKCPSGANSVVDGKLVFDREKCTACGVCTDWCIKEAREIAGKEYTVDELVKEAKKDQVFYEQSGGGVTLSGGEVSCQSSFALELLKALKRRCIHTAIETNLCFSDAGFALLREADLIMADVKTVSAEKFAQYIGSGFGQVLENLKALEQCKTPLIIRTPVVPGVNDGEEEIRSIALLLKGLGSLEYYELLSYHPLGEKKGECIDIRRTHFTQPSHQAMLRLAGIAKETGIDVRVDGKRV